MAQHQPSKCPVEPGAARGEGACPVQHKGGAQGAGSARGASPSGGGECPVDHRKLALQQKEGGGQDARPDASACPYHEKAKGASTGKDESAGKEELNPRNMMPAPNQTPAPGQRMPLPTHREKSSIPKAGAEEEKTWEYPSQQMFYNALRRKGKLGSAKEEDMASVVAIHNYTNERAWRELLKWEEAYKEYGVRFGVGWHIGGAVQVRAFIPLSSECPVPKLVRFRGKYDEPSMKARFRMLLGGKRPFDRHDWVVDRCGHEVRYIIDYYDAPPDPHDPTEYSIKLDVRPALDSPSAAFDRVRMAFRSTFFKQ